MPMAAAAASFHSGHGQRWDERTRTADVTGGVRVAFKDLLLPPALLEGLASAGYTQPSPVQAAALPVARLGVDVMVQAKSGTGKTLVFAIVALEAVQVEVRAPQALIIAPTREIAVQINDVISAVGRHMTGLRSGVFVGGLSEETDALSVGECHICVGTPGRLALLMRAGALQPSLLGVVVLDEADKLMDSIFSEPLTDIFALLRPVAIKRQIIACSATYPEAVRKALAPLLRDPQLVRLADGDASLQGVRQYYSAVDVPAGAPAGRAYEAKIRALLRLLDRLSFHQCIVFLNQRSRVGQLADLLNECGWSAANINGGQEQQRRFAAMADLRQFRVRVLVSTDLIARGVDMERVNVVINVDVPPSPETYMHRVGRTGRFGSLGLAVTLVTAGEMDRLDAVRAAYNVNITPLDDATALPRDHYDYSIADRDEAAALARLAEQRPQAPLTASEIEQRLSRLAQAADGPIDAGRQPVASRKRPRASQAHNERARPHRPFLPPDLPFDLGLR